MLLVANSTPIVVFDSKLNSFRVNLDNKFDFPTPESPISTTKDDRDTSTPYSMNTIAVSYL